MKHACKEKLNRFWNMACAKWKLLCILECVLWGIFAVLRVTGVFSFRMKFVPLSALILLLFNGTIFAIRYNKKHNIRKEYRDSRRRFLFLLGISLLSSLPLFITQLYHAGGDLYFHLFRIEGIKDYLMEGGFPARNHPNTLWGYGYAASIFYPEALLYFPVALRFCGFSLMNAYKVFLLGINVLTTYLAYYSFSRIFANKKAAMLGSAFYVLNLYRLVNLYARAAVGEACAMAFLPLVILGMYRILTEDTDSAHFRTAFLPLLVGMMGLISSHLVSCEMILPLLILVCLLNFKRFIAPKRLLAIIKAAVFTIALSACFWIPVLDYIKYDTYWVFQTGVIDRSAYAIDIPRLFALFPTSETANTTQDYISYGIGFATLLVLCLFPMLRVAAKEKCITRLQSSTHRAVRFLYGLGFVLLIMSSSLFPWKVVFSSTGFIANFATIMQFPFRLLSICAILFSCVVCECTILLQVLEPTYKRERIRIAIGGAVLVTAMFFFSGFLEHAEKITAYSINDLPMQSAVGGGEYLRNDCHINFMQKNMFLEDSPVNASSSLQIDSFYRKGTKMQIRVSNAAEQEATVELPKLMYLGYVAQDEAGNMFYIDRGKNSRIRLHIPGMYEGLIYTEFREPLIWRLSEMVSLTAAVFLIWSEALQHRRKRNATALNT